jgi:hypothetical protein
MKNGSKKPPMKSMGTFTRSGTVRNCSICGEYQYGAEGDEDAWASRYHCSFFVMNFSSASASGRNLAASR